MTTKDKYGEPISGPINNGSSAAVGHSVTVHTVPHGGAKLTCNMSLMINYCIKQYFKKNYLAPEYISPKLITKVYPKYTEIDQI